MWERAGGYKPINPSWEDYELWLNMGKLGWYGRRIPQGLFRYEPAAHELRLAAATDVRRVTGYQDFVDTAPLDLVYVADHARMRLVPAAMREAYAYAAAGAMAQNVYLYCASAGLATVIRAWFDRDALARAMALGNELQLLLAQTVGLPGEAAP